MIGLHWYQNSVYRLNQKIKLLEMSNAAFRADEEECNKILKEFFFKYGTDTRVQELKTALDPDMEIFV